MDSRPSDNVVNNVGRSLPLPANLKAPALLQGLGAMRIGRSPPCIPGAQHLPRQLHPPHYYPTPYNPPPGPPTGLETSDVQAPKDMGKSACVYFNADPGPGAPNSSSSPTGRASLCPASFSSQSTSTASAVSVPSILDSRINQPSGVVAEAEATISVATDPTSPLPPIQEGAVNLAELFDIQGDDNSEHLEVEVVSNAENELDEDGEGEGDDDDAEHEVDEDELSYILSDADQFKDTDAEDDEDAEDADVEADAKVDEDSEDKDNEDNEDAEGEADDEDEDALSDALSYVDVDVKNKYYEDAEGKGDDEGEDALSNALSYGLPDIDQSENGAFFGFDDDSTSNNDSNTGPLKPMSVAVRNQINTELASIDQIVQNIATRHGHTYNQVLAVLRARHQLQSVAASTPAMYTLYFTDNLVQELAWLHPEGTDEGSLTSSLFTMIFAYTANLSETICQSATDTNRAKCWARFQRNHSNPRRVLEEYCETALLGNDTSISGQLDKFQGHMAGVQTTVCSHHLCHMYTNS